MVAIKRLVSRASLQATAGRWRGGAGGHRSDPVSAAHGLTDALLRGHEAKPAGVQGGHDCAVPVAHGSNDQVGCGFTAAAFSGPRCENVCVGRARGWDDAMGFSSEAGGGDPLTPFDMATAALLRVDSHGVIAAWNQAAQDLLGYTAVDVLGHSVTTLLVDEGDVSAVQSWLQGAENGWKSPLAALHREGRPVEVAVRACRLHALGGHREWLVALRDAAALREDEWHEDVARSLLQQSPLGVAVLDTDLRYQWVNRAMAHLDEEGAAPPPARPLVRSHRRSLHARPSKY